MKRHKKTHSGVKPYRCEFCQKNFNRPDLLKVHEKTHSENGFQCDQCSEVFSVANDFKEHKKTVHPLAGIPCDECNEVFSVAKELKAHKKKDHPETKCKECKAEFPDPEALVKHAQTHLREKPYKCAICEKSFSDPEGLVHHVTSHTKSKIGKKEHRCETCDKVCRNG